MPGSSPIHVAQVQCHRDRAGCGDPVSDRPWEENEMNNLKTIAPVTLLLVLVIAAMGVMVFWGVSLLDLSE